MFQILKHITQLPLPIAILLLAGECVPWLISMGSQPTGEVIVTLLFAGLAASLMVFFFRETTIVHDLDYLPAVLYMGAMAVFPSLHTGWKAQLVVLVLIGLVALLYRGFRQKDSTRDAFTATLIMLLSSLLIPDIIWLVPGIWIAYMLLSSFNFRTLLATLIAIGTFALYVGLAIWQGWMQNPYAGILDRHWIFEVVDAEEWLMPVVLAGLGLYYFIFAVMRSERESIRQRTVLMLAVLRTGSSNVRMAYSAAEGSTGSAGFAYRIRYNLLPPERLRSPRHRISDLLASSDSRLHCSQSDNRLKQGYSAPILKQKKKKFAYIHNNLYLCGLFCASVRS